LTSESLRLFFALDPPAGVRQRVAALQRFMDFPSRAVPPANFHITLAFLGQVASERLPELKGLAQQCPLPAGVLELDCLGGFPRAGVAWLDCSYIPLELVAFQQDLVLHLEALGFRSEARPWRPHLTLYRKMRKPFATIPFEAINWPVDSFCLMQSRPGKDGPQYRSLGHW